MDYQPRLPLETRIYLYDPIADRYLSPDGTVLYPHEVDVTSINVEEVER